jgi:hypothetical protein
MQLALGRTSEDEYQDNLRHIGEVILFGAASSALLFFKKNFF